MMQLIGLAVCVVGFVVCAYVFARTAEMSQRDNIGKVPTAFMVLANVVSLLAVIVLIALSWSIASFRVSP